MKKKSPPNELARPEGGETPRALAPVHPRVLGAAPVLDETAPRKHRKLVVGVLAMSALATAASIALYTTRTIAADRAAETDWMERARRTLPTVGDEPHVDGAMRTVHIPGTAAAVSDDPAPKPITAPRKP